MKSSTKKTLAGRIFTENINTIMTRNRPEARIVVSVAVSQGGVIEEHPLFAGEVLPLQTRHFVHDLFHFLEHFVPIDVSHRRLLQPFADHTDLVVIHL